jgi:hypothetical protein
MGFVEFGFVRHQPVAAFGRYFAALRPCRSTRSLDSKYDGTERGDRNQPRLRAKGFGENPNQMIFVFQDISNWKRGTEHINGLELFFKNCDHLSEQGETLNPATERKRFSNSNWFGRVVRNFARVFV